ncbi:hypothetical protein ZIOFF_033171 [Zingiber officinale]|uniref:Pectate lyase superfamily protein domain-containing protein n=1 Tax=Zingiber officinale TaxID=94328 RepID=A0A8J5L660_ZINOF|nr:hypothetical protein ZIOFF_033171 [Zingiber officinale]
MNSFQLHDSKTERLREGRTSAVDDEAGWNPNRKHVAKLTDFSGVGDGMTLNTGVFAAAMGNHIQVAGNNGAMLIVPAGRWLTRPFNLTSTFALFLEHYAVILAAQNLNEWSTIAPLPSYGRGNLKEALWLFDEILERRIEA